jgi:hypothetical protein
MWGISELLNHKHFYMLCICKLGMCTLLAGRSIVAPLYYSLQLLVKGDRLEAKIYREAI